MCPILQKHQFQHPILQYHQFFYPTLQKPPNSAVTPSSAAPAQPSPLPAPVQNTHLMLTRSKLGIFKPKTCYKAQLDYTLIEPPSFKLAQPISQWCQAMQDEYDALIRQGTWSLVPPPQHHNIIGCKWVYKLKTHNDGSIARYKARLVAKGFHQQQGIDFDETFSPVIKPPTVRMILSLAVSLNWPLRQLDVSNAFLHGILKEEVYMSQPQGYISAQHPDYVCRLHKSIYGLKQAPRAWFERFTGQLLQFGFTASAADSSLFIYRSKTIIAYLLLYVDDIVLTSNTPTFLDTLIQHLSSIFELKDLGPLHYFLGIQVTRDSKGLHLSQAKYATTLLHKHNMTSTKPVSTPCTPNTRLSLHDGEKLQDPHAYRSLVGALHYLTFTRPDLSFAVHQVCQYMASPTSIHLTAAKRILRYLKGTLHLGLSFRPGPLKLSAFTDADWAGDPDDRRSTSGLLVYLGPNPITWSAKKQLTVSRSSTESEYRALALASAEVCWLRTLLKDLGVFISEAPILWCDNISALAIASNPVFHARTKHIEVDFHFVRERVLRKDLAVKFVSTHDQLADIFTKSLPPHRFLDLRSNLMASYGHYGTYSKCSTESPDNINSFECTCLPGYEPKSPRDWYLRDGSQGCVRKQLGLSMCGNGEGFVKLEHLKGPDSSNATWMEMSMSYSECEQACLSNCSCTAFTSMNIDGKGTGCLAWYGELMDILENSEKLWVLNVRVDANELGSLLS
uniref:Apple domain-containing protein n=1 Tax=Fagus sylvatica TaxID=28930 RepID=A0A2N9GA49_FAGSY